MAWMNDACWHARESGTVNYRRYIFDLSVVDCGELIMPSGQLIACDPFVALDNDNESSVTISPGRYPVFVTIAQCRNPKDVCEAYASLILSDAPEMERRMLGQPDKADAAPLTDDEYYGFGVDAGTACFVDAEAVRTGMPPKNQGTSSTNWHDAIFDNGSLDSWFKRMDDPAHIRAGIANIPLPLAQHGENIILFHSGMGDGFYPLVGGYDAQRNLVAVHIDFMLFVQR